MTLLMTAAWKEGEEEEGEAAEGAGRRRRRRGRKTRRLTALAITGKPVTVARGLLRQAGRAGSREARGTRGKTRCARCN
jgi:hypothetical protein